MSQNQLLICSTPRKLGRGQDEDSRKAHSAELVMSKGNNKILRNKNKSTPLAVSENTVKINEEVQPPAHMLSLITGDNPHDCFEKMGEKITVLSCRM